MTIVTEGDSRSTVDPAAGADRPARLARYLERARSGDRSALDGLVRELNPLLWHVARAQGLGAEEAADVVQTSWMHLLRRLPEIHTPQAVTAWLVTATRREAWHERRRGRRLVADGTGALESTPDAGPDLDDRLLTAERDRLLWRHVRELPARCRELLRALAQADRPDYTAVAEALGMPRGSIGPTRGRCLAKLRAALAADPAWSEP